MLASEVFDTSATGAGLAHDITDTDCWPALLMTSQTQTAEYKMAALMVMSSQLSDVDFLTNKMRNQVKECNVSTFHSIPIDGACDIWLTGHKAPTN